MKPLTWKLVLPLTIISFVVFSKWWFVALDDGSNEILTGFPVPYMCPGWHTSLSLQIFVSGLVVDLLTYFVFWFTVIFLINQFVLQIRVNKTLAIILLSIAGVLSAGMILIASIPDNIYRLQRDFEIKVLETGYKFIWQGDYVHPDD